jgi:hypothetical protein
MCSVYAATQRLYHQQLAQELVAAGIDPEAAPEQPINLLQAAPRLWEQLEPPDLKGPGSTSPELDMGDPSLSKLVSGWLRAAAVAVVEGAVVPLNEEVDLLPQYVLPDLVTLVTQGGLLPCKPHVGAGMTPQQQQQVQQGAAQQLLQALVTQGLPPGHVPDFLGDPGSVPAVVTSQEEAEWAGDV